MMCSISGAASRQFTGTPTAPSLASPNITSKNSAPFFSTKTTRSPKPTPDGAEGVGGAAGPGVEFGEGDHVLADHQSDRIRPLRGVHTDEVGDRVDFGLRHAAGDSAWVEPCRFINPFTAGGDTLSRWRRRPCGARYGRACARGGDHPVGGLVGAQRGQAVVGAGGCDHRRRHQRVVQRRRVHPLSPHSVSMTRLTALSAALDAL